MKSCPTCRLVGTLHELQATGFLWCSNCGTAVSYCPNGAIHQRKMPTLYRSQVLGVIEAPGLLAVATSALGNMQKALDKVDRASLLRDDPIFHALEALHEAQLAVVTELQARDAEDPTGLRLSAAQFDRASDAVLAGIRAERERCAAIVEQHIMGVSGSGIDKLLGGIARTIRTVT